MTLNSKGFEMGEMKYPKNWVGGAIFKKTCQVNQKGEDRENAKVIGGWDFFIFISSDDGD